MDIVAKLGETKPLITVLTATYNRAALLPVLKASLDIQDFRDFEWIVVDDGSTDGTTALLESWKNSTSYGFSHFSTPNGGKHRSINRGVGRAAGEWVFIVDSDDRLPPGALSKLGEAIVRASSSAFCGGIAGLKGDSSGALLGERYPEFVEFSDSVELRYIHGLKADKAEVFRTGVLKGFPFPEFEGEKFINEGVAWNRIARAGWKLLLLDHVIYLADYRADGLSASSLALRVANPRGTAQFYKEKLALDLPLWARTREAVNYGRFAFHARRLPAAAVEVHGMGRALVLVLLPLALAAFLRDKAILAAQGG